MGFAGEVGIRWWTRSRLQREIHGLAGRLAARGVEQGDRILLWAPNSPEWAAVFLAAAGLGAITVPVDDGEDATTAERLRRHIGPRLALAASPPAETASESSSWLSLGDLYRSAPGPVPPADIRPEDPVVAIYTSGTTGEPREVLLDHGNLTAQLLPFRQIRKVFHLLPFRALSLAPASHVLGLVVGLVLPLYLGMPTLYTSSLEPHLWARVIRGQKLSVLVAVPRLLQTLQDFVLNHRTAGRPLSEELAGASSGRQGRLLFWRRGQIFGRFLFRVLLVGGAELSASAVRFWRRTGLVPVQGYGLTETAAFVSISRPFGPPGSLGQAVGNQELRVAPDGELLVRGPNLSSRLQAESRALESDGFLPTGDLVRLDGDSLYFIGRKSEVIVTGEGLNISPGAVESELLEESGVRDAAAVPWRGTGGIEVHVVLVLDPDVEPANVVRWANRRLGPQRQISGWTLWPEPELPRGRLGKLLRGEILRRLPHLRAGAAGSDQAPNEPGSQPDLEAILRDPDHDRRLESLGIYLAARIEDPEATEGEPAAGATLADLGLGSLDRVQLLGRIEQRIGGFSGPPPLARGEMALGELVDELRAQHLSTSPDAGQGSGSRLPPGQPAYALFWPVRWLRRGVRAATALVWRWLGYRAVGRWHGRLPARDKSFLVVAEPHRHWLDSLAIYQALPRSHRRRPMVVTNRDFRQLFEPEEGTPWSHRVYMAGAYYLVLPLLFCFSILSASGRVREGLLDSARLLGKGYRPLTFPKGLVYYGRPEPIRHDPGLAWLALETGTPLLPVVIEGNFELGWKLRRPPREMTVHFGELIEPLPGDRPEDLIARVEAAWAAFGVVDDDPD